MFGCASSTAQKVLHEALSEVELRDPITSSNGRPPFGLDVCHYASIRELVREKTLTGQPVAATRICQHVQD